MYFVNIFVSKDTLTKIIKGINKSYGKTLLDEICITNFIRFEGFRKLNKQKKYITGSEYEVAKYFKDNPTKYDMDLTHNLCMEDFYEAMYCFNDPETKTLIPIPDINNDIAHTKSINNITAITLIQIVMVTLNAYKMISYQHCVITYLIQILDGQQQSVTTILSSYNTIQSNALLNQLIRILNTITLVLLLIEMFNKI